MAGVLPLFNSGTLPYHTSTANKHVESTVHTIQPRGYGFSDIWTNKPFIPRGANYILLYNTGYHATFNVGLYDASGAEAVVAQMSLEGYNVVRVFLNPGTNGGLADPQGGLSSLYLDNLIDFIRRAGTHSMKVILTQDEVPSVDPYAKANTAQCCSQFDGTNMDFLTSGGLQANDLYWHDLVLALEGKNAPMSAIFAYELRNEAFFQSDHPPLSLTTGFVTTANGKSYDMSDPAQKELMMNEGLVYWVDQLRSEIRQLDPGAMVTIGFYPGGGDWVVRPKLVLADPTKGGSSLDFVEVHTYPGWAPTANSGSTLDDYMKFFGVGPATPPPKPLLMGEFGAFKIVHPDLQEAANALMAWQVESCEYYFSGWLVWTWNTPPYGNYPLWNALDKAMPSDTKGAIDSLLAPVYRPNACS